MSENAAAEPLTKTVQASTEPGFLEEAKDVWKQLPHKSLFAVLLIAWIALFHYTGNATLGYVKSPSLFNWLKQDYDAHEEDAHGLYVPIVVLIFFWLKRKELLPAISKGWWPALIYFAFATLLQVLAYRVQQSRISALALIFGFHALLGVVWGPQWIRRTFFPVFLLLFSIPFGSFADIITIDLRVFVTKVSVWLAHHILGVTVFADGSRILNGEGRSMYEVAPACSGLRSLIALAALAVIYAFLNFDRVWKRTIIILSAVPLALFGNIFRITTVIEVGEVFSEKTAALIEQKFGFITFLIAIAGMMGIGWFIREKDIPQEKPPNTDGAQT